MRVQKHCFIRADANPLIGSGHVMRCFALMQELRKQNWQVTFVFKTCPDSLLNRITAIGGVLLNVPESYTLLEDGDFLRERTCGKWVVLDGYQFSLAYQERVKTDLNRVLMLDDNHEQDGYAVDCVLNQNLHALQMSYNIRDSANLLLGPEYALLRDEFYDLRSAYAHREPEHLPTLMLSFGGADPLNLTAKILKWLEKLPRLCQIKIILGASYSHALPLQNADSKHELAYYRTPGNMATLMSSSLCLIGAAGSTCWELAFLGIPSMVFSTADNQKQIAASLHDYGTLYSLGDYQSKKQSAFLDTLDNLLVNKHLQKRLSEKGQKLVTGDGKQKVVAHMSKN